MNGDDYEPASYSGRLARRISDGGAPRRGGNFRPLVRRSATRRIDDILQVEPGLLAECLLGALAGGRGVLLASTFDGGALSVTVYDGDDRLRTYCASAEEFTDALCALRGAPTRDNAQNGGHPHKGG
jgi:hypothetical protein